MNLTEGHEALSDIEGNKAEKNPLATIPFNIFCSSLHPDIVIINQEMLVYLFELTVPNNFWN